jgi:hypothetical protein
MANAKVTVQISIRISLDLKSKIEEMLWLKKKNGENVTQTDLLIKYIESGLEKDEKTLKPG